MLQEEEAKKRRKQEETLISLERIQQRIATALVEYETDGQAISDANGSTEESVEVSFEHISDPVQLYELLNDTRIRSKYEKHLTIVLVGFEEKCQAKEQVLLSLDTFFQETRAGNTEKLLEDLEAEEIDFENATAGLENAMETATQAATKLMAIKNEISQLLAVAAAFPDNKKGRKKLEKALVKAQDEVQKMTSTLETIQVELDQSKEKCDQLQKSLEAKTAECGKLRKTADQVQKLQTSNNSLKAELENVSTTLKKTEEDFKELQTNPPVRIQSQPVVNEIKVKELEQALEASQTAYQKLQAEKGQRESEFQQELEALKSQFESDMAEMKAHHEEQLRSLVVDADLFEEEEIEPEEVETIEEEDRKSTETPIETIDGIEEESPTSDEVQHDVPPSDEATVIATIQREHAKTENALKSEIADIKNKSRKMVTSLKAQLAEAESKLQGQLSEQTNQVKTLTATVQDCKKQREELEKQVHQLKHEKEELVGEKELQLSRVFQLEQTIEQLHQEMQQMALNAQQQTPQHKDFSTHSTQWSDGAFSIVSTPRSILSIDRPLISMEEVLHNAQGGTPLSSHSIVLSSGGASLQSNIHPHASPLHGSSNDKPATIEFPALALSRLSRHSQGSDHISLDHPLVQEWNKAYEQVMKFKEAIVEIIQTHYPSNTAVGEVIQDLMSQSTLSLNGDKDIQGQVTQMRFTLALTLHQLETALQECLTPQPIATEKVEGASNEVNLQLAHFQQLLYQTKEHHQIELQKNQDTIANLSAKVDSLKAEIIHLRHFVDRSHEEDNGVIFFTRLDADRNEKALQEAVINQQMSQDDYQSISSKMNEYLAIPGQRLKKIAHKINHETQVQKAIESIQKSSASPEHTSRVISMIQQLQEKRKLDFNEAMNNLTSKRLQLANNLQSALTKAEKTTDVFLIKPKYPTQVPLPGSLMMPLHRNPPSRRTPLSPSTITRKRVQDSGQSTPHPTMRLINDIRSTLTSRQQQCQDNSDLIADTSPLQQTRPSTEGSHKWTVASSRAQSAAFSPILPRLIELETTRLREPEFLLGSLARKGRALHPKRNDIASLQKISPSSGVLPPIHIPSHQEEQIVAS